MKSNIFGQNAVSFFYSDWCIFQHQENDVKQQHLEPENTFITFKILFQELASEKSSSTFSCADHWPENGFRAFMIPSRSWMGGYHEEMSADISWPGVQRQAAVRSKPAFQSWVHLCRGSRNFWKWSTRA